ncbi:hypothetical protein AMTRI_Chr01g129230 [Amborella trichopoda]
MLTLSPSYVYPTTFSWPLEEQLAPLNVESFNGDFSYHGDPHISQSFLQKLTHNANERDRRTKLNSLYSSLRSLLPESEQGKRMSIPTTFTLVLKYLPELQKEVDSLIQRREKILARAPVEDHHRIPNTYRGNLQMNSLPREEEGLMATDASSFAIGGHGVVYNFYLLQVLKDKILRLCRMSKTKHLNTCIVYASAFVHLNMYNY